MGFEPEPWFRRTRERQRRRRVLALGIAVLAAAGLIGLTGIGMAPTSPYDRGVCRELPATRTGYYHPVHGASRDCGIPPRAPYQE